MKGDFLCARCREDRDIERAQKRQDAIDAAVIDEFAAKPETVHRASNLDLGLCCFSDCFVTDFSDYFGGHGVGFFGLFGFYRQGMG